MAKGCPKGKGKGKGKGTEKGKGKGKGKTEQKGKGKGKGYQGTCWNCGKVGHKSAECTNWDSWSSTSRSSSTVNEVEETEDEESSYEVDSVWEISNVDVVPGRWRSTRGAAKGLGCGDACCGRGTEGDGGRSAQTGKLEDDARTGDPFNLEPWQRPKKTVRFSVCETPRPKIKDRNYWRELSNDEPLEISNVEPEKTKITIDSGAGECVAGIVGIYRKESSKEFKGQIVGGEWHSD